MTDYRKFPNDRPKARSLDAGDKLSPDQARLCPTHLRCDFGLELVERRGYFLVVKHEPLRIPFHERY